MQVLRGAAVLGIVLLWLQPLGAGLADSVQFRQILTGTIELDRPTEIAARRLVFNNFTIITNGFPLEINADTLTMAGESRIIAFAPREILPMQRGRTAGPITLNVRDLDGDTLTIVNDGERGGPGLEGASGAPGTAGESGSRASDAWWTRCQPGSDGGNGGPGGAGGKGGDGAAGGTGGDVVLNVRHDRDKLVISTRGGSGGVGGTGGVGGPGGAPGQAGSGSAQCAGGRPGSAGPAGPKGEPGTAGVDGVDGRVVTGTYDPTRGVKR